MLRVGHTEHTRTIIPWIGCTCEPLTSQPPYFTGSTACSQALSFCNRGVFVTELRMERKV